METRDCDRTRNYGRELRVVGRKDCVETNCGKEDGIMAVTSFGGENDEL